jgi:hypothetical protein
MSDMEHLTAEMKFVDKVRAGLASSDARLVGFIDRLLARVAELEGVATDMERRKDAAYEERNRVVALAATLAFDMGCTVGVAKTVIEGWSEDWHGCVYIDLPDFGQCSWHFHDSHARLFSGLPPYRGKWDGHTTEEKYRRIERYCGIAALAAGATGTGGGEVTP